MEWSKINNKKEKIKIFSYELNNMKILLKSIYSEGNNKNYKEIAGIYYNIINNSYIERLSLKNLEQKFKEYDKIKNEIDVLLVLLNIS